MKTDVLIAGGGPSGSAVAMCLLKEGIKPVIVEAEPFPRYHIGESMSGAAAQAVRALGLEAEMTGRQYPVKCGVKVYGQSAHGTWYIPMRSRDEKRQLFDIDTWQVRRSDFDQMMLDAAVARGATLVRGKAARPIVREGAVKGAEVRMSGGGLQTIESEMLLDCTGQGTWLANLGGVTGPKYLGAYDKQIAFFSQVRGGLRDEGTARNQRKGNTLIFYQQKFHWAWFIPLSDEVVSVGIVCPSAYFLDKRESKRGFLTRELHEMHPELKRRLPEVELVEDVHVIPNYSFQVKNFCGKGFMCVGDSHRFVDPIFSFGIGLGLREAEFAAPAVKAYLEGKGRDQENPFAGYQLFCEKGIDVLEDFLDTFWEHPFAFAVCVHDRYRDLLTDVFSGRVYEHEDQPSVAINEFRRLLGREGARERSYVSDDLYSIPIGSRYHPERAPIWEANSPVGTTETWLATEEERTAFA